MFSSMDINIAAAKPRLSELVERAEKGEVIRLARRGKPVIEFQVVTEPERPTAFDWNALTALVAEQQMWSPPPGFEGMSFVEYLRRTDQL